MELVSKDSDVKEVVGTIGKDMGDLSKLITNKKGNLVDAINETALRSRGYVSLQELEEAITPLLERINNLENGNSG